jgi:hypothetical protein
LIWATWCQTARGCQFQLTQAADGGHCYLPEPNLIREAAKILGVGTELIGPCLDELVAGEGAVCEPVPASGDAEDGHVDYDFAELDELAHAVRTRGAGRRHTALTHRLNPVRQASQPERPAPGKDS